MVCLVLWGIGGGSLGAQPLIIDDFDSPDGGQDVSLINNGVGSRSTSIVNATVPGSIREISIEIQAVTGSYEAKAAINIPATGETYQLTQSSKVDSFGLIVYDGNVLEDVGNLNLDLSGFAGIRLAGVENDFSTPFTLTLETSGGGSSNATSSILLGDLDFLFSSLVGTATLSDIDRISLLVDPQKGGDVAIDGIITIRDCRPRTCHHAPFRFRFDWSAGIWEKKTQIIIRLIFKCRRA